MRRTRRFWPLDYDQEVAIYDNPSWDLPGHKRLGRRSRPGVAQKPLLKLKRFAAP
jgi:hypothetical protein